MTSNMSWGARVEPEFRDAVFGICKAFDWTDEHAGWLMACMAFESARTFSPSIRNAAGSGAVGLIQFMPSTAKALGTRTEALAQMTPVEQLGYVEKYFKPYAQRIHSLSDMYMAILLPKYVGEPDDSVLFTEGTVAYRQNSGLDQDSDGNITKGEVSELVRRVYEKGLLDGFVYTYEQD